jgi:tRNA (guanine-N7-)-methyltransferase
VSICPLFLAGQVFLQSDVYNAVVAMRDEFEQYAGDILQLSPLHTSAATFQWTPEQEAAAAAASEDPSDIARRQQQQQQEEDAAQASSANSEIPEAAASSSSSEDGNVSSSSSSSQQHDSAEPADAGDDEVQSEEPFVSSWAAGGWLVDNLLGVPTEREHYVKAQGGKVFRVLLVKQ